jgi:UDP-N-acetylmuramoylalanine--D-glutamate ligase
VSRLSIRITGRWHDQREYEIAMTSPTGTWQHKRVTIMGLGSFGGGVGLTRYLARQGARVTVTDLQSAAQLSNSLNALTSLPIHFVLGEHREQDFVNTDVVFVNPAVPLTSRYLEQARQHRVPLDSEINLFVRECRGRIVGITGSVGKSTTTSLLGSILQLHDARTLVGGNIGGSLLPHLDEITPDTPVVLELSSFQLEHLAWQSYSPPLAMVLNLAPNHLDRHGTMEAYQRAKEGILAYQTPADTAILNWDDTTVRTMASRTPGRLLFYSGMGATFDEGVYSQNDTVIYAYKGRRTVLCHATDVTLQGRHNLGNAAAAAAAAALFGVPPATIARGLRRFQGLPHRLERVTAKNGVEYYNDSKATTPVSTLRALEAFEQPVVLLAGGYDKGTPFDELAYAACRKTKATIVYGATAAKLLQAFALAACQHPTGCAQVIQCPDLEAALTQAVALTAPGDVVLLSPACASYDQFPHYEARGDYFRTWVHGLPD